MRFSRPRRLGRGHRREAAAAIAPSSAGCCWALALVTAVLAALTSLSWIVPGLAVLVALGSLVGLRRLAAQATAARVATRTTARPGRASAGRPAPRRAATPARRTSRAAASAGRPAKTTTAASTTRRSGQPARTGEPAAYTSATATTVLPQRAARDEVFDVNTFDAPAARPAASGDAWSPTPVPPPTYTLKAKAVYAAAEEAEDEVTSPYADVSDLAERRRRASGQ